ncbi:BnaCnng44640D [Brassica napus]|uniref:BnaCnng44640D protein n=1 Tax=Brassica napus TaxID=3708 RepID=A0A078JAX9_BRANA|nr:BnaCnng44640D [Brassica napus]
MIIVRLCLHHPYQTGLFSLKSCFTFCFDVVHARSVCTLWRSICLHHYAFIYVCLRFTLLKEALSP